METTMMISRLLVLASVLAFGCGSGVGPHGSLVGAACASNGDCDSRCVSSDHYPGGMCTLTCASNANCPDGTSCIDDAGGICAVNCRLPGDCALFGAPYACDSKGLKGADGSALVCRVP
jgi:hypothetical protein